MTRPVFCLGTGRCGSTLLHEVLARHEGTGFVTNLDDLGLGRSSRWQNDLWRRLPPRVTRKGGARFAPSEGYRVLSREVGPVVVDPVRDLTAADATPWLQERMRAFVAEREPRLRSSVFLHKFTGWPRSGFLQECFPDALFVEVLRDGRAVASSWLQMPWWRGHRGPGEWHFGPLPPHLMDLWEQHDRSLPVLAALGWRLLLERYDECRAAVPEDRWVTLRYEDLLADPRERTAGVLDAMGLPWTDAFATGFGRYEFASGRSEAFRRDLAPRDVAAMEDVLGDLLVRHGYHR